MITENVKRIKQQIAQAAIAAGEVGTAAGAGKEGIAGEHHVFAQIAYRAVGVTGSADHLTHHALITWLITHVSRD